MRILIQILLILLAVSTISICAIKPDMHKYVMVYNSDYMLVPEEVKMVEKEEIPIMEVPVRPKQATTKNEKKVEKPQTTTKVQQNKIVEKKQPVKTVETKTQKNETNKQMTVVKQEQKKTEPQKVQTVSTRTTTPSVEQITTAKTSTSEEIAWNVWRSNLQNKIMQDAIMPVLPQGTVFKFSFTVDKFGKISNVQTWSTTASYTPYAIQYIAPIIRSYQGKDILNFPGGSTRFSTEVNGGWRISSNEKFSTPQDYHDIEKVIK